MSKKAEAPSTTEEVLDFSFNFLKEIECVSDAESRTNRGISEEYDDDNPKQRLKSYSRCLLISNNLIADLTELPKALKSVLFNPFLLGWLDLSFNLITDLPPVFKYMTSLKILYLHGNSIVSMDTIPNLKVLNKTLTKLTLHGNPIEEFRCYRMILVNMMTNLKELDFSLVTKSERGTAKFLLRPKRRISRMHHKDD